VAEPECSSDSDCDYSQKCQSGTCIEACRTVACGRNARCKPGYHDATCECLSGYKGDAYSACLAGGYFFKHSINLQYFIIM
jgi:hypothetical protein